MNVKTLVQEGLCNMYEAHLGKMVRVGERRTNEGKNELG
jgi:hypothetical protein